MKKYSELGTVHRGEPCQEYPGTWIVVVKGENQPWDLSGPKFEKEYFENSFQQAFDLASKLNKNDLVEKVSIYWECSDNDPRVGKVWFTGFYRHGWFDIYGRYNT